MYLEGIFGAFALDKDQRRMLVKSGSARFDGGVDSSQDRDLGNVSVSLRGGSRSSRGKWPRVIP